MVELANTIDLGSIGEILAGSSPVTRTKKDTTTDTNCISSGIFFTAKTQFAINNAKIFKIPPLKLFTHNLLCVQKT